MRRNVSCTSNFSRHATTGIVSPTFLWYKKIVLGRFLPALVFAARANFVDRQREAVMVHDTCNQRAWIKQVSQPLNDKASTGKINSGNTGKAKNKKAPPGETCEINPWTCARSEQIKIRWNKPLAVAVGPDDLLISCFWGVTKTGGEDKATLAHLSKKKIKLITYFYTIDGNRICRDHPCTPRTGFAFWVSVDKAEKSRRILSKSLKTQTSVIDLGLLMAKVVSSNIFRSTGIWIKTDDKLCDYAITHHCHGLNSTFRKRNVHWHSGRHTDHAWRWSICTSTGILWWASRREHSAPELRGK